GRDGTRSVQAGVPTQSVGTRNIGLLRRRLLAAEQDEVRTARRRLHLQQHAVGQRGALQRPAGLADAADALVVDLRDQHAAAQAALGGRRLRLHARDDHALRAAAEAHLLGLLVVELADIQAELVQADALR